jgi:hypothetical protein
MDPIITAHHPRRSEPKISGSVILAREAADRPRVLRVLVVSLALSGIYVASMMAWSVSQGP